MSDIWASPLPSNSREWDLTQYRSNPWLRSGKDFQFRVTNLADSTKWDFSPYFTLTSDYSGTFAFTSPTKDITAMLGSTLQITWSSTGNVGKNAVLTLYKSDTSVVTVQRPIPSTGNHLWIVASPLGSGENYQIRIHSISDPSIACTGPAFTIASSYSGSYEFLSPSSGDTVHTGVSFQASWTTSGNPGSKAELSLWRDAFKVASMGTTASADQNTLPWSPPVGLKTGTYHLRLTSLSDGSLFAFSPPFNLIGVPEDDYESDNASTSARPITVGASPQAHTLTLQSDDWMYFIAEQGRDYRVTLSAERSLRIYLLDSTGQVAEDKYGNEIEFNYTAAYGGLHHLVVFPNNFDGLAYLNFGSYDISIR